MTILGQSNISFHHFYSSTNWTRCHVQEQNNNSTNPELTIEGKEWNKQTCCDQDPLGCTYILLESFLFGNTGSDEPWHFPRSSFHEVQHLNPLLQIQGSVESMIIKFGFMMLCIFKIHNSITTISLYHALKVQKLSFLTAFNPSQNSARTSFYSMWRSYRINTLLVNVLHI